MNHELAQKAFNKISDASAFRKKIEEVSGRQMNGDERKQYNVMLLEADTFIESFNASGGNAVTCKEIVAECGDLPEAEAEMLEQFKRGTGGRPQVHVEDEIDPIAALKSGPAKKKDFRSVFGVKSLGKGGFKSMDDFLRTVHSGLNDPRLKTGFTMGISSDPDGGFLVPDEMGAFLWDGSLEDEIVRPRATVWPMATSTRKVPAWDGSDHTSNLYGGLVGQWLSEEGTGTNVNPKLKMLTFNARKLAIFSAVSNELIADGDSVEGQLGAAITKALGWFLDLAFLTGTGVGQPLGILNDPAMIVVNKEADQAVNILYANLVKMFARLHPACVKNSVWLCSQTTIPELTTLTIGDELVPVMKESNGQFSILTRPVIFTEKVPALGAQGDITLVDFSQYHIGMRKEMNLEKSNAPGWATDVTNYRNIVRVDGFGAWKQPVTPLNGDTLSWCVTLQERTA